MHFVQLLCLKGCVKHRDWLFGAVAVPRLQINVDLRNYLSNRNMVRGWLFFFSNLVYEPTHNV